MLQNVPGLRATSSIQSSQEPIASVGSSGALPCDVPCSPNIIVSAECSKELSMSCDALTSQNTSDSVEPNGLLGVSCAPLNDRQRMSPAEYNNQQSTVIGNNSRVRQSESSKTIIIEKAVMNEKSDLSNSSSNPNEEDEENTVMHIAKKKCTCNSNVITGAQFDGKHSFILKINNTHIFCKY